MPLDPSIVRHFKPTYELPDPLDQQQKVLTLAGLLQQQQARAREEAALSAFAKENAALPADASWEQRLALGLRHARTPEAAGKLAEAAIQHKAMRDAQLQRIYDQARVNDNLIETRLAQTKDRREQMALEAMRERNRAAANERAMQVAGERLFYDTGVKLPTPTLERPQAAVEPGGVGSVTMTTETPAWGLNLQNVSQQQLQALLDDPGTPDEVKERIKTQMLPTAGAPAAAAPTPAPSAAPPVAPAVPTPRYGDEANLDVRDLRARQLAQPLVPAAPAQDRPFPAMPPEIAAAPKKLQDQWKLQRAKELASSGAASDELVRAIGEGRIPIPSSFALRTPWGQQILERVSREYPNFNAAQFTAQAAARRTFASGPEARNVTALNTVIGHLGTLDAAAHALMNNDIRLANAVFNRIATEIGDPRIQNFDTAKQAVAEETMRVFRQVGASEMEARMWGERITSSGSPAQLRGVISTLGELLDSRVSAIAQQYERTVKQTGNPAQVDPKNRQVLDRLIEQGRTKGGASVSNW